MRRHCVPAAIAFSLVTQQRLRSRSESVFSLEMSRWNYLRFTSWFIHDSKAYSVAAAPPEIFKAAILAVMDRKKLSDLEAIEEVEDVLSGEMDLFARW